MSQFPPESFNPDSKSLSLPAAVASILPSPASPSSLPLPCSKPASPSPTSSPSSSSASSPPVSSPVSEPASPLPSCGSTSSSSLPPSSEPLVSSARFDLGAFLPFSSGSDLEPEHVDTSDLTPDDLDAADDTSNGSRFQPGADPQAFAHLPRETWVVFPPSPKVSFELWMLPEWHTSKSDGPRPPDAFFWIHPKSTGKYKGKSKNLVVAVPFYMVDSQSLNFYLIPRLAGHPAWVNRSKMLEGFYDTPNRRVQYIHGSPPKWEFAACDTSGLDWSFNVKDLLFKTLVDQRLVRA